MGTSERVEKIVSRLGKTPKFGDIKKLAREVKVDHELALELWSSGNYYLRLLSALIFDKKLLEESDFELFASDLLTHEEDERNQLSDWLLANQLTKDKKHVALLETWQENPSPVLRRWFWYHQARLRWMGRTPPPQNSAELLNVLQEKMGDEEPGVQWAMNFCAGWIGIFEPELRPRCIKLGKKLGLYEHDPVARNCTPSYLPEFIRIEVAKRQ
ncbi:MAG: DNA alkylation repair protein [Gammaproteobacteria bacterium]|nr:DNA alkylation repair protein [Gammaproteobacteria bacterium]